MSTDEAFGLNKEEGLVIWRTLLALTVAIMLTACASSNANAPRRLVQGTDAATTRHVSFYVGSHGWHTSIIIPRAAVPKNAWPAGVLDGPFHDSAFIETGWGDRTFYMAPHPNVVTAFDAVFLPGASVLHIVGLDPPVRNAFAWSGLVEMRCSATELRNVGRAIGATFARDGQAQTRPLGDGLYGKVSKFYPATGRYYFANTCNNWTARMIQAGGFPADAGPAGTWSAGAVMAQARRLARERDQRMPARVTRTSGR